MSDAVIYWTIAGIVWAVASIAMLPDLFDKKQIDGDDVASVVMGPPFIGLVWPIWLPLVVVFGMFNAIAYVINKTFKRESRKSQ